MIDEEVARIIAEQYERAKEILRKYAREHNELADVLFTREVIFTEDVERIFGKRRWASRTDEILAAQKAAEERQIAEKAGKNSDGNPSAEAPASMPPIPGAETRDNKEEKHDVEDVEAKEA